VSYCVAHDIHNGDIGDDTIRLSEFGIPLKAPK